MMDLRQGILATAQSLGIDPIDLGTAISYETAGTFDPTKAGPTTQWGQHRGLIQFGEPQAKQYGVDWNDPIGSQLGENGAVAKYLRGAGVKPGMGMMDIYSAINAGSVGRYGASDANNGGAPGTVADKVNGQMAGHREKAMALLGNITGGGGNTMIAGNPQQDTLKPEGWLTQDRKDALIVGLEGMTMNPNEALVEMAGGRIKDRLAEAKSNAAKSKTTEWLRSIGRDDLAAAVESGSVDGGAAAGEAFTDKRAKEGRDTVVVGDNLVDRATGEVVFAPAAQDPSSTVAWLKAQGREDLASGVQSGAIPAADAVKSALNPPSNGITITNPDGTTTQIGGRPGGALTSANQTDAQKAAMAYESLTGGLDAYESLYDTGGGAVIPGKQKDALTGARTALQLQMKELFNLGVLNGPDLDLMNKLLVDATSVENAALDTIGVANLDDRVAANLKQLRETLKGMVAPKIAAMGGGPAAVTTAPLASGLSPDAMKYLGLE